MKLENTLHSNLNNATLYPSVNNLQDNVLCLCDPITQICKRIEAFFFKDPNIHCRYIVNNNKPGHPEIDPDTGEQMTRMVTIDGQSISALVESDHLCEFRVFCNDYEEAENLSNVIRHRHIFTEIYQGTEEGELHVRDHILIVRVFMLNAVDPDGEGAGSDPGISDDDTNSGLVEIFGLEPIDWDDPEGGCNERLSPSDSSTSEIPKGYPEEWEQQQWEQTTTSGACAWKWVWLKGALKHNRNIADISHEYFDGRNTWRFIECNYIPIAFQEDNLTSTAGYNSILPADLLPLVFSVFGAYQLSTHVSVMQKRNNI